MPSEEALTSAQLQHDLTPQQRSPQRRDEAPISFDQRKRCWLVTSHEAVTRILRDARFVSRLEGRCPHESAPSEQHDSPPVATLLAQQLLFTTGAAHRQAYAVIQQAVSALEKDEEMRRFIADVVSEALTAVLAREEMDVVKDLAAPVSGRISARFVGLPSDDPAQLARWIAWSNAFGDRTSGDGQAPSDHIYRMQLTFLSQINARKGKQAQQGAARPVDLLDALLAAPACFPHEQVIASNLQMLFSAGRMTCEQAISGGVLTLLEQGLWPQVRAAVLADASGLVCQRLADEWQRYVTPTRYLARVATQDVLLEGFDGAPLIRRGHKVVLFLDAANRDPSVFDDAERFDPQRHPNRHVAFGAGPHTCPGAGLARLLLPTVLAQMAQRISHLELKPGARIIYRANPNMRGLASCPILLKSHSHEEKEL